jgi:hypothetical protein
VGNGTSGITLVYLLKEKILNLATGDVCDPHILENRQNIPSLIFALIVLATSSAAALSPTSL